MCVHMVAKDVIWGFPKLGVPLVIIQFHGAFHEINHPFLGTPMIMISISAGFAQQKTFWWVKRLLRNSKVRVRSSLVREDLLKATVARRESKEMGETTVKYWDNWVPHHCCNWYTGLIGYLRISVMSCNLRILEIDISYAIPSKTQ